MQKDSEVYLSLKNHFSSPRGQYCPMGNVRSRAGLPRCKCRGHKRTFPGRSARVCTLLPARAFSGVAPRAFRIMKRPKLSEVSAWEEPDQMRHQSLAQPQNEPLAWWRW